MIYSIRRKWGYILAAVLLSLVCLIGTGQEAHAQGSCTPYTACASAGGTCVGNSTTTGIGVRFAGQSVGVVGGLLGKWYYCTNSDPYGSTAVGGYYMGPGWCVQERDYIKDPAGGFFFYTQVKAWNYTYYDNFGSRVYVPGYGWLKHIYYPLGESVMLAAWMC